MTTPVVDSGLPAELRAVVLYELRCRTLERLAAMTRRDALAPPGVGRRTVARLEAELARHGLAFTPVPPRRRSR